MLSTMLSFRGTVGISVMVEWRRQVQAWVNLGFFYIISNCLDRVWVAVDFGLNGIWVDGLGLFGPWVDGLGLGFYWTRICFCKYLDLVLIT